MGNGETDDAAVVPYAVEIDGKKHSEHVHFVEAIKEGLILRGKHRQSRIKVRDLSTDIPGGIKPDVAA